MASSALAQSSSWTAIGGPPSPGYGGYVRDIRNPTKYVSATSSVADAKVWMATDGGGVFSTEDNGATWVKPAGTLGNRRVFSTASYPSSTAAAGYRLFLGTFGGGVMVTADAGASFSQLGSLTCNYVRNLRTIATSSSTTRLLAGTDCEGSTSGVHYQDMTAGSSVWTKASGMPDGIRVYTIAPVGATSSTYNTPLMAGTSNGIYKSADNGQTWTAVSGSPTGTNGSKAVYGVTYFSSSMPLFATVESGGVYASTDGGTTWTARNTGLPTTLPLVPSSGYIGTTDSGATLYAAFDGLGIYKSSDQGVNWTQFKTVQEAGTMRFMTAWTTSAGYRFIGTSSGALATNDSTFSTSPTAGTGQPGGMADNIEVDSAGAVYAGMVSGVYRLNTTTSSWEKVGGNLPDMLSGNIKVRGTDVYASTTHMGVYKLTGGQGTWQAMNTGLPTNLVAQNPSLRIDSSTTNSFYLGLYGAGFYYWNGTAASPAWEARNTGLSGNALKVRSASTFGQAVLLSTDDGVYYSANGGTSWAFKGPVDSSGNRLRADQVAIDQSNASTMYAAVSTSDALGAALSTSGVWRSTDSGATWTQLDTFKGKHAHHVRVGFTGSQYITLVGVWDDMTSGGGGLYVSQDSGQTWSTLNTGLTSSLIGSTTPLSNGGGYLATRGGGIFVFNNGSSSGGSSTGSTGTGTGTGTTTGSTTNQFKNFTTFSQPSGVTGAGPAENYAVNFDLQDTSKAYKDVTLSSGSYSVQSSALGGDGFWHLGLNLGSTAPATSTTYTVTINSNAGTAVSPITFTSTGFKNTTTDMPSSVLPNSTSSLPAISQITWKAPSSATSSTMYNVSVLKASDYSLVWSTNVTASAGTNGSFSVTYGGPALTAGTTYRIAVMAQNFDSSTSTGYGAGRSEFFCPTPCSAGIVVGSGSSGTGTTTGTGTSTGTGSTTGTGTTTGSGTTTGTGTTSTGTGVGGGSGSSISLVAGWNLVGNSTTTAMPVSFYFGDKTKVTSVWAWSASTSSWAFYSPALADGGVAYAATKGYTALTTIQPGAGFWVNAVSAQTVTLPSGSPYVSTFFIDNLPSGWSLNSIGDSLTPRSFNNSLSITPPSVGSVTAMFVTLWAWDAKSSLWYFYAPSLDDAKGSLTTYATGKGYKDFGTNVLSPGTGFWVNQK